jgi:hypothetical protein
LKRFVVEKFWVERFIGREEVWTWSSQLEALDRLE